jgi:hypothetical protein
MTANETYPIGSAATLTRLSHRCLDVLGETLHTERLIRTIFVIAERCTELVLVTLEAQTLSKLTILIFEFRGRLLEIAQLI